VNMSLTKAVGWAKARKVHCFQALLEKQALREMADGATGHKMQILGDL
jgi:hypothetical protein